MSKGNILVVDDTPANLELLESILDDEGYDVRTSLSGEGALKSIEVQSPDIILLDIMMPDMDGYETCEKIKQDARFEAIPVIFLSAKGEIKDKIKGFNVGAIDYLTKPFDIDEILVRIKTHLSLYFMQEELEKKLKIIDKYVITSSTDLKGNITHVSEAFCKISGFSKDELLHQKHNIMRHSDIPSDLYEELWSTVKKGNTWHGEIKNKTKNGDSYWVDAIISPDYNSSGDLIGYSSVRHDISNQKRIEELSITDQLTGLHNRRHFNETFHTEIKRCIRHSSFLSFVMLDIDFFKQYNDTYGHQEGDNVLEKIGETLREQMKRDEDFSFRLGGEEFGIICNTKDCTQAKEIAENVRKAIQELNIEHRSSQVKSVVTASLGVVCVDFTQKKNYELTDDELYKIADDELYKAKNNGRNQTSIHYL